MTIWLLALILLASLAGLGYRQGAIRVAFSFLAVVVGAVLAVPLGRLIKPLLAGVGVKDPVLQWLIPPIIVFIIISAAFKAGAAVVHRKVDVHFKYQAGELRMALWERLHRRLGLCLGLLNATAYLILICFGIYISSYWTHQLSSPGGDPKTLQLLNRLGKDLEATGFNRVAHAIDKLPATYYDTADVVGIIYHNPLAEARVSSYPAFLTLAERPEFQQIGDDKTLTEMRQKRDPIMKILEESSVDAIIKNPDLLRTTWGLFTGNLADFRTYLNTGKSPKYDPEEILGRWRFNVSSAFYQLRRAKPNMTTKETKAWREFLTGAFQNARLIGMTEGQAALKNIPPLRAPVAGAPIPQGQNYRGTWQGGNRKYQLSFPDAGKENVPASIDGDKLTFTTDNFTLVFSRED
jgi:hypothetical protein